MVLEKSVLKNDNIKTPRPTWRGDC